MTLGDAILGWKSIIINTIIHEDYGWGLQIGSGCGIDNVLRMAWVVLNSYKDQDFWLTILDMWFLMRNFWSFLFITVYFFKCIKIKNDSLVLIILNN